MHYYSEGIMGDFTKQFQNSYQKIATFLYLK